MATETCRYHLACNGRVVGHLFASDPVNGTGGPVPVCARAYREIEAAIAYRGRGNAAGQTIALCDCLKGDYCPRYGAAFGFGERGMSGDDLLAAEAEAWTAYLAVPEPGGPTFERWRAITSEIRERSTTCSQSVPAYDPECATSRCIRCDGPAFHESNRPYISRV